jgi:hypothetical protein
MWGECQMFLRLDLVWRMRFVFSIMHFLVLRFSVLQEERVTVEAIGPRFSVLSMKNAMINVARNFPW